MSYTEIYAFKKNGDCYFYGEAQNSNGSAPLIWRYLWEKYGLGPKNNPYPQTDHEGRCPGCGRSGAYSIMADPKPLWNLADNKRVTHSDRVLLFFTFDAAYVKKSNILDLVIILNNFYNFFIDGTYYAETIKKIIEYLNEILVVNDIMGVAFNMTSVSEAHWHDIDLDEDGEERRPFNLYIDKNWYDMFEEIEKIEAKLKQSA